VHPVLRTVGIVSSVVVIAALLLYVTNLRSAYYQPYLEQRSKVGAAWKDEGIEVAVVWPEIYGSAGLMPTFREGVRLGLEVLIEREIQAAHVAAAAEIALAAHMAIAPHTVGTYTAIAADAAMTAHAEATEEAEVARRIKLIDFKEPVDQTGAGGQAVAHRVVRNGKIIAVLGHMVSASTIPASIVYEQHGILFITGGSTDPRLTQHQFLYTFRISPRDHDIADAMVRFAWERGWRRPGMFFARSELGEALAPQLTEEVARYKDMKMAFTRSYVASSAPWTKLPDYRQLIAQVRPEQPDVLLLADSLPRSAKVLKDLREMNLDWPILTIGRMESADLPADIVKVAHDVHLATGVNPNIRNPEFLAFQNRFKKAHRGQEPSLPAIDGFEAIKLLVSAIAKTGSADPLAVATTLHEYPFEGLYGPFEFSDAGDIQCRVVAIKQPVFHVNPTPPPALLVTFQNEWEHAVHKDLLPCSCRRPKEDCK
jgi:branched-chain amino acid transport system substrate-binding protein